MTKSLDAAHVLSHMSMKLTLFSLVIVLTMAIGCGRKESRAQDVNYVALREAVIKGVKDGTILPDANGKAILPQKFKEVCKEGYIYISNDSRTGLLIVFIQDVSSEGQKILTNGLLYCDNGVQIPWNARRVRVAGIDWQLIRPEDDHFCFAVTM